MELGEYLFSIISIIISSFYYMFGYKKLSPKQKLKFNLKTVLIIFLISNFVLLNTYHYTVLKLFFSLILYSLLNYLIYNDDFKNIVSKTSVLLIIGLIMELIFSGLVFLTHIDSVIQFDKNLLIKSLFSFAVYGFSLFIICLKHVNNILRKIIKSLISKKANIILLSICYITFVILAFNYSNYITIFSYVSSIILIVLFSTLVIINFSQQAKVKEVEQKQEALLDFMSKYERIIDDDRINKHEMLNHLLIIKSFKKKNSIEFNNMLDELIKQYNKNSKDTFNNIYNLPSGLKGILYYKIYDMKNENINVDFNIAANVVNPLEHLNEIEFMNICKILGILLDNAKEATLETDEKFILIDIYKEQNKAIIYIENSVKKNVNKSSLNVKGYSTKGIDRGLGLYIVNTIVKNSNSISIKQNMTSNKRFSTTLVVNIKKN